MKYQIKNNQIEALTFNEFVQYGRDQGAEIVANMPWVFEYEGLPVSHENDSWYLISTPEGNMDFHRGNMLIREEGGKTYPCTAEMFEMLYEQI